MRRRLLLCATLLMLALISFAHDVIITTESKKIEAKILEVSKSEIKYKEADNLDGPTFILPVNEIESIIYSNGKVVLYNPNTPPAQEQQKSLNAASASQIIDNSALVELTSGEILNVQLINVTSSSVSYIQNGTSFTIPASQINTVTFSNGQVKTYVEKKCNQQTEVESTSTTKIDKPSEGRIYRDNNQYLYNDTYISSKEVLRILERENKEAYKQWKKADGMLVGGAVCAGIGGGLAIGGLFPLIFSQYTTCLGIECAAIVPLGIGLGLTLGASAHYNKAIDIYNSKFDHVAIQLRWGVSVDGIGVAFAF